MSALARGNADSNLAHYDYILAIVYASLTFNVEDALVEVSLPSPASTLLALALTCKLNRARF